MGAGRTAGHGETLIPLQVGMGAHLFQTGGTEQLQHGRTLVVLVFQNQPSSRRQGSRCPCGDGADRSKPISAAIQGQPWLVPLHERLQRGPCRCGYVRRIGHHHVQKPPPGLQWSPPLPRQQLDMLGGRPLTQIASGLAERLRTDVDAKSCRGRR